MTLIATLAASQSIAKPTVSKSTGAIDSWVVVRKDETVKLSKDELRILSPQMSLTAMADMAKVKIGSNVRLHSYHMACIYNLTKSVTENGYRFSLSALSEDIHSTENFSLGAESRRCVELDSYMVVYPRGAGRFDITAWTTGDENKTVKTIKNIAPLYVEQ